MYEFKVWSSQNFVMSDAWKSTEAAVRMRLDQAQLPRPLQLSALTNRELRLESAWKRFLYLPPRVAAPAPAPAPAAADKREAQGAAGR